VFVARRKFALVATAAGLALSVAAQAAGSADHQSAKPRHPDRAADRPRLAVLDKPARHFDKSVRIAHRRAQRAAAAAREAATSTGSTGSTGGFPSPESVGVSTATLESIAACESGGDPAAVSPDGTYRGKYQFDYGTWASVGGSGDPAAASAAEQDYRAALLYSRGGSSPWPICGS
jgi:soluble lytic murein transglycosylase-like protein